MSDIFGFFMHHYRHVYNGEYNPILNMHGFLVLYVFILLYQMLNSKADLCINRDLLD